MHGPAIPASFSCWFVVYELDPAKPTARFADGSWFG